MLHGALPAVPKVKPSFSRLWSNSKLCCVSPLSSVCRLRSLMGPARTVLSSVCRRCRASSGLWCTERLTLSSSLASSAASSARSRGEGAPYSVPANFYSRSFFSWRDTSRSLSQLSLPPSAAEKLLLVDTLALEKRLSAIQRETEKLRVDIEKLQSEIRFEMDKVSAGQRLDLNLERGRIKEELANQSAQTSNLTNKLDKEINTLKTQLEGSKYEVIKYCIGTIVSVYALGLALLRVFK